MPTQKEVKKEVVRDNFYLTIFELIKQGFNPSKISIRLNLSKQRINYYLRRLKNEGIIEKKGYGTWEVKTSLPYTLGKRVKEIRGHAFIWVVKIPQEVEGLMEKASKIGVLLNNGQIRLFVKDHKVWIGKKNIVIYESKSFYGKNSIEARKYSAISLIEVLKALEGQFNIRFRKYIYKPSREHYGQIKNDLARQYNRKGEKMLIHDDLEGGWLWIDDSDSLGELETKNIVRSKQVQDWWNDQKKHNFEVTPTFLLNSMNQITNNQVMFDKNFQSHLEILNKLSNAVDQLTQSVKEIKASSPRE